MTKHEIRPSILKTELEVEPTRPSILDFSIKPAEIGKNLKLKPQLVHSSTDLTAGWVRFLKHGIDDN